MRNGTAAVLVAVVLMAAACGGSDESGSEDEPTTTTEAPASDDTNDGDDAEGDADGGTVEFCEQVEVFDAISNAGDGDEITEDQIDEFDLLVDAAPYELTGDLEVLADVFRQLADVDPDDEESFGQVFELILDPEFIASAEAVEAGILDECGIDIDPDDSDDDVGDFDYLDLDDLDPDTDDADVGDPDSDELGLDAFDAYLAAGDFAWVDDVVGKGISTFGDEADVTIDFPAGTSDDDALAACEAGVAHFGPLVDELTVTVSVGSSPTATAGDGSGCALS